MLCNVCGSTSFNDANGRVLIQCSKCGSLERTRLLWLYLQRHIDSGRLCHESKVLHIAPESGIYSRLSETVNASNYRVSDYNPNNYKHITTISKIDLTDLLHERSNQYDFIIHSHVLEHIECNIAYPLFHLHRMLKHNGHHIFIVPFTNGEFEESFVSMSIESRTAKFGQFDHIRNFGNKDLHKHLGCLLNLPSKFQPDSDFPQVILAEYNIPMNHWNGFHAGTVFDLSKNDYLLSKKHTKKQQRLNGITT